MNSGHMHSRYMKQKNFYFVQHNVCECNFIIQTEQICDTTRSCATKSQHVQYIGPGHGKSAVVYKQGYFTWCSCNTESWGYTPLHKSDLFTCADKPDGLIHTPERWHIYSLSAHGPCTTNTSRVLPRSTVSDGINKNLQWILWWNEV